MHYFPPNFQLKWKDVWVKRRARKDDGFLWLLWQFDSWPLKVENQRDPGVCKSSATHRWKTLKDSYKFVLDLIPIGDLSKEVWTPKVPGVQIEIVSGLLLGSPGKKCHSNVGAVTQRILYGGRWWLPSNPGHGESCESKVACGLS
jgi:hypothetical protein